MRFDALDITVENLEGVVPNVVVTDFEYEMMNEVLMKKLY